VSEPGRVSEATQQQKRERADDGRRSQPDRSHKPGFRIRASVP
jgi:hypothetical protein